MGTVAIEMAVKKADELGVNTRQLKFDCREAEWLSQPVTHLGDTIYVYSNAREADVLKAIARVHYSFLPDDQQIIWKNKLVYASEKKVNEVNERLHSQKPSDNDYGFYRGFVEGLESPISRLIAIHVCNAFLANHVSPASAIGVDIRSWPSTEAMCSSRKRYSLIPLLSAYGPRKLDCFGESVVETVHGSKSILHSEVAQLHRALTLSVLRG